MIHDTKKSPKNERGLMLGMSIIIWMIFLVGLSLYHSEEGSFIHFTKLGELFFSLYIISGGVTLVLSNYYAHKSFYFRVTLKCIEATRVGKNRIINETLLMGYSMIIGGLLKIIVFDL